MDQEEIWKDIEGYEGYYKVSNLGRVKSMERVAWNGKVYHKLKERILIATNIKNGYSIVGLNKDNVGIKHSVHRLVANAFLPNPENKKTVNHINGVKIDNRLCNLEMATYSENGLHAYKIGLKIGATLGKFGKNHPRSTPIVQLTKSGIFIAEYEGIMDAHRQTGLDASGIVKCCKGKYKTVGGNVWKYKKDYNGRN